jgi:hypothetical protein
MATDVDILSDLLFLIIGIFNLSFTSLCICSGTPALSLPNKIVSLAL